MKHVILTPNPYRDKGFQTVRRAMEILQNAGVETKLCLPFDVDRSFELPKDLRFHRLDRELSRTDGVVCFGGDGTILHMAKVATRKNIPILGVNIGTVGFLAELESTELDLLTRVVQDDFTLDSRSRTLTKSGKLIELTQVEFQIMEYFFSNPGVALDRTDILNHVWGEAYVGEEKIVDVNIRRLRMKVEDEPSNPKYIVTVWGLGYKWDTV